MKLISMTKYRLHRYFYSSRPVFPLIITICFLGIMGDRKMAVAAAVGLMILSIAKDAVIEKYRFLTVFGMVLPSVMKPARDLGNGIILNSSR